MKHIYIAFLFTFFISQAFAQKDFRLGYIVQNGDTVHGLLDYRGSVRNSKVTTFKTDKSGLEQTFTPDKIAGYGFKKEDKVYEAQTVPATQTQPAQQLFLQTLIKGKASIYLYKDSFKKEHYYLSKDGEDLQELISTSYFRIAPTTGKTYKVTDPAYLRTLASAFSDCGEIDLENQKDISFTARGLTNAAKKYNLCMGGDIVHLQEPKKPKFAVMPVLVYSTAGLYATGGHSYTSGTYTSTGLKIGGGLAFNMSDPAVSEKISIQFDLLYAPHTFEADLNHVTHYGRVTDHKLLFDIDYVKVPVQLRYTFPKGKIRPYVNAGISYSYAFKVNQLKKTNSTFQATSYYEESEPLPDGGLKRYKYGLVGGAGLSYPINRHALFLETRYEVMDGFSTLRNLSTRIKGFSFLVGYSF